MEKLASQLPKGFSVEWTGVSLQEQQAGSQTVMLLGFSMPSCFWCWRLLRKLGDPVLRNPGGSARHHRRVAAVIVKDAAQ
jgi:hypothetical protein